MVDLTENVPPQIDRFRMRAVIVGVAALVLCAVGAIFDTAQFFRSYLLGYIFWAGITLGCLAILMVQHLSGGAWGVVIRRPLESATRTLPLLALMFVPVAAGASFIYVWARPEDIQADPILEHAMHVKHVYLNVPFFIGRAVFYFLVWIGLSYMLNKWSREQDETGYRPLTRKLQVLSGPGLVLFGLTVTFAAVDWIMSLEPAWFSTIFGILIMGGQALSAMAFVIAVLVVLSNYRPMSEVVNSAHLHDLGKLMLAFLMLWAYFSFSQFLIIWSANIPEEVTWYTRRLNSGWRYVGLALIVLHFALPFVLLLSRDLKRNSKTLAIVAVAVIFFRFVDLLWLTGPEFHHGEFLVHWMDLLMPVGIGGVWLWFYIAQLKMRPLLPVRDPYLEEAIAHGGGH